MATRSALPPQTRVAAVAGIAGAYNSPAWVAGRMSTKTYRAMLASFIERYNQFLPAVAPDNGEAAMAGDEPYSYYGTMRGASAHWRNEVTRGSLHSLMTFDALAAADLLTATPLLVVHGTKDHYCSPDLARMLHERAQGPKEIAWLETANHTDLYDTEPFVTQAAELTAAFLKKFLSQNQP